VVSDAIAAINVCAYLFLLDIQELAGNGLRLVVSEGRLVGEAEPIRISGAVISGGTRIDVTSESRVFELLWDKYVAYAVLNESFASVDDAERYEGN
jgi:hypothetical protein